MKQKHRSKALAEVLERARSRDFDEREHALFQLALLLERGQAPREPLPEYAADALGRHLLRIVPDRDDQNLIVETLARMAVSFAGSRATIFWALGKADPALALGPLLALLQADGRRLEADVAYQAAAALDTLVSSAQGEAAAQLNLHNPRLLLELWSGAEDERLAVLAERLLAKIVKML